MRLEHVCVTYTFVQLGAYLGAAYVYHMFPGGTSDPPRASGLTCYPVMYKGMVMLAIPGNRALHIHHWLFYLPIGTACFALSRPVDEDQGASNLCLLVMAGYSLVLTLHGLIMYEDRCAIVEESPYTIDDDDEEEEMPAG